MLSIFKKRLKALIVTNKSGDVEEKQRTEWGQAGILVAWTEEGIR